jgi:hypothetical protein
MVARPGCEQCGAGHVGESRKSFGPIRETANSDTVSVCATRWWGGALRHWVSDAKDAVVKKGRGIKRKAGALVDRAQVESKQSASATQSTTKKVTRKIQDTATAAKDAVKPAASTAERKGKAVVRKVEAQAGKAK